jgi:Uma2 family endonuclease
MTWVNTSPLVKTYTLEEFWELPEPPDHSKLELIAGVLYMTPPPGSKHDSAVSRLNRLLSKFLIASKDTGTLYVPRAAIWTSRSTYLEPDLFYVLQETESKFEERHRTTADLVIEVISPGSAVYDRNTKADTYAALNVTELWLVDEVVETLEIRNQNEGRFMATTVLSEDDVVSSYVLPSLSFQVKEIFANPKY